MNRWQTIFDGGSGQWLEMRRFGTSGRIYHAVRIDDMDDACGSDNEGHPKYAGDLLEIDLDAADIDGALKSCSFRMVESDDVTLDYHAGDIVDDYRGEIVVEKTSNNYDIALAEMVVGYGGYAPLSSESSNNLRALMRNLKRESREMDEDEDKRETALSRPVNAIGSTAREYARGDFDSAMARGLAKGDDSARIMAQIYRPISQNGITAQVSINDGSLATLSDGDPLAYMMGFMSGFQGTKDETPEGDDFAPAYLKGREHGARVRMGLEPKPDWIN